jgi:hypothetical protein
MRFLALFMMETNKSCNRIVDFGPSVLQFFPRFNFYSPLSRSKTPTYPCIIFYFWLTKVLTSDGSQIRLTCIRNWYKCGFIWRQSNTNRSLALFPATVNGLTRGDHREWSLTCSREMVITWRLSFRNVSMLVCCHNDHTLKNYFFNNFFSIVQYVIY